MILTAFYYYFSSFLSHLKAPARQAHLRVKPRVTATLRSLQVLCPLCWGEACSGRCTWAGLFAPHHAVFVTGWVGKFSLWASTSGKTWMTTPFCMSFWALGCPCSWHSMKSCCRCMPRPDLSTCSPFSSGSSSTWAVGSSRRPLVSSFPSLPSVLE